MDAAVQTIPGERMKARREQRVALLNRAVVVLDEALQSEADGAESPVKTAATTEDPRSG